MKVMLKVDHENGRIVMDRTFANLAVNVRTEEYKILQDVRLAYPTYIVVRRTIKKNPNRECYRGLTYDYRLLINDGNYYLLGYDEEKRKMLTYRVDRMKDVRRMGEPRDGADAAAAIEINKYAQQCFSIDIPSVCAIVLTRAKPKTYYNALVERYDRLKAQYDEVSTAISDNEARYEQMGRFITVLKDQEGVITEFDDALWSSLVEKIVVKSKEDVTVVFKDGTEMKAE